MRYNGSRLRAKGERDVPDPRRTAHPREERAIVLANVRGGPDWWRLRLRADRAAATACPGQFAQVRVRSALQSDPLLARPLSFCTLDPVRGEISLVYRVVGRGTQLLSRCGPGDEVPLLAPLGRSFPGPEGRRGPLLLVGGGLGIPPLVAAAVWARARAPRLFAGARHAADLAGLQEADAAGVDTVVVTEDGSRGERGLVTDIMAQHLGPGTEVWACGPNPMLARVAELCRGAGADAWLALERPMACGFGVCMGCAVAAADGGYLRACVDGPVFPAAAIDVRR